MEQQQEEGEYESWEDAVMDKVSEPRSYDSICEDYHNARLQAINAKEKKGQEQSGQIIRISVDTLAAEFESRYRVIEESKSLYPSIEKEDLKDDENVIESCSEDVSTKDISVNVPSHDEAVEYDDIEVGDMFPEDSSSGIPVKFWTPWIVEMQKKEKMKELTSEKNLEKLEGIWKKVMLCFIYSY